MILLFETFNRRLTGHPKLSLVSRPMAAGSSGIGGAENNIAGYALSHTEGTTCP